MTRLAAIAAGISGALLLAFNVSVQAQDEFKPQLKKISVNGAVLYEAGAKDKKTVEIDSAAPAKVEYTFVNTGAKPSEKPATVFVHFGDDQDIALGADYKPATASTAWEKGKDVVDKKDVDFSSVKGKTLDVFIGLYLQEDGGDRLTLVNEGFGDDQRLPAGAVKVK